MTETLSTAGRIFRHEYPDGHLGWFVTGYELGKQILSDPRFSQRPLRYAIDDGGFQDSLSGPESAGDLLRIDPPDHTRVRRLQTGYFTVKQVGDQREKIERIVDERLDVIEQHGAPADFVSLFAYPVPSMAICDMLGVRREDRGRFEHPSDVISAFQATTPVEKKAAMDGFYAYIREVIAEKRSAPGDDLLTELVSKDELSDDELAGVVFFLFAGGHHTTMTVLSLSLLYLLSDRDRWDAARAAPADRRAEELLRMVSPIGTLPRTAMEDVELADGTVIRAGESITVYAVVPSGDAAELGDLDRFDPSREPAGHLAFGGGRHMCLGQHLARLELQISYEGLMTRFPNLRLAVPAEEIVLKPMPMPGRSTPVPVGVERLPVAW